MRSPDRHGWRWAIAAIGLALAALLTSVRAGSELVPAAGVSVPGQQAWKPLPIAVNAGRARFTVPTPGAHSRTVVVVSSLARGPKTFPVRLTAKGTTRTEPPVLAQAAAQAEAKLEPLKPQPIGEPAIGLPPRERSFQLMVRTGDVASAGNYEPITAELSAVGYRVQVYIDKHDVGSVTAETLRDLVTTFDDQILPLASRNFGVARDVDGDGRFTVFMTSWLTRLGGGKYAVDGFVRGADFDEKCAPPFSNRCDMMYVSTGVNAGPHLRTLLAHEYTHAVTFTSKLQPDEDGWLDEGLAHLAEDLHGFSRSNLDYRVSAFLSRPERYRLVVEDYYADDLFRSHGNRGATYLFLRWCADRFGPGLIPALVRSPARGVANLEAATGFQFADLYRQWSTALFLNGLDPSRRYDHDYRELNLRAPFEDWELAGPRAAHVVPDGAGDQWDASGTASHYIIVDGSPKGAVEIDVTGTAAAELQVTAVPLPEDLARIELRVTAREMADGGIELDAHLEESQGTALRLSALAWEPVVPGVDPHTTPFRRGRLDMLGVASKFGSSALAGGARMDSRPIYLPTAAREGGSLVLKAIGTDAQGRRVAAWADVELSPLTNSAAHANDLLVP
ncbi:MAG: hypothetical protein P4L84_24780 [Isosphaeraceae bacterium]|nr:hypothetical protein [Isosphaeraceae bacterium]